jgi:hypothetical protein
MRRHRRTGNKVKPSRSRNLRAGARLFRRRLVKRDLTIFGEIKCVVPRFVARDHFVITDAADSRAEAFDAMFSHVVARQKGE